MMKLFNTFKGILWNKYIPRMVMKNYRMTKKNT